MSKSGLVAVAIAWVAIAACLGIGYGLACLGPEVGMYVYVGLIVGGMSAMIYNVWKD